MNGIRYPGDDGSEPEHVRERKALEYARQVESAADMEARIAIGDKLRPTHLHVCLDCGHAWRHGPECFNDKAAHTCSECGRIQWAGIGTAESFESVPQGNPGIWVWISMVIGPVSFAVAAWLWVAKYGWPI